MLDNKEIIAKLLSERHVVNTINYAVTMNVVAREMSERADEAFEDDEYDMSGAAFQDLYLEANNRYRREMHEALDSIMERHGSTLGVLGITSDMVHEAMVSYATEVYDELVERLQR